MKSALVLLLLSSAAQAMVACPKKMAFEISEDLKCPAACFVKEKTKLEFSFNEIKGGMEVVITQGAKGEETKVVEHAQCPATVIQDVKVEDEFVPKRFSCQNKAHAWIRSEVSSTYTWATKEELKKYGGHLKLQIFCLMNFRTKKP